jgi:eukaryotic-like serine/threonine-protein kinase
MSEDPPLSGERPAASESDRTLDPTSGPTVPVPFDSPDRVIAGDLPQVIGPYRILRLIGKGGMGAVYEAEQQQPRRLVALKVIRPGWVTPDLLRRFAQESSALGRLQHPGIAQIYEAGAADTVFGT